MLNRFLIALILLAGLGCEGTPNDFIVFKKDKTIPVITITNAGLRPAAEDLCDLFEQAAGFRPKITENPGKDDAVIVLSLMDNDGDDQGIFRIHHEKNKLLIEALDIEKLFYANSYFFEKYAGVRALSVAAPKEKITEIRVPNAVDYRFAPSFEYREPYFPDNFKEQFRRRNMTQTLDEEWGLWGHNISKVVPYREEMFARVNGEVMEDQYCFSSPELEKALVTYVKSHLKESPKQDKYMVMPNDNNIVCHCDRCKAAGNSEGNASPAVFALLNKLAKQFPETKFFGTAYITTANAPGFKLEPNTGVMVSTIDFPKGVVLADSERKGGIEKVLTGWKEVTDKIYIWDYAVNFDNYFGFYPTVDISQKNLQFYKGRGVTGVFMHGSEERYAAFGGLKCYLYARLFQDLDANIKRDAHDYLTRKYPVTGGALFNYYTKAEQLAMESPKKLDIYGGVAQAQKKYLDESGFVAFYDNFIKQADSTDAAEKKALQPMLLAFTFQRLEMMRAGGLKTGGYGTINENMTAKVKPEVWQLLERLKTLKAATGINTYNEVGNNLDKYLKDWEQITAKEYKNLYFGKTVQVLSELDEDYPDARVLNDGAIGFTDYYNNWLIASKDSLKIRVDLADVKGAKEIGMSFLHDPRHKIYLPQKVLVTCARKTTEGKLTEVKDDKAVVKYTVTIPFNVPADAKDIIITVLKQEGYKNRSVATDELFFN